MNNNFPIQTSANITTASNLHNNYIVFTIKEKQYAINIKNVLEIINIPEIEIAEKTPKGIIGMFNYNSLVIKAVDLCPFLGFETPSFSINNQMIIAVEGENCFAIHTEKIENVLQFEEEEIQKIPYDAENSILNAIYKNDGKTINIIDIKALNNIISQKQSVDNNVDYSALFPKDEKSLQILKLRSHQHKINQESFSFPVNVNSINQYVLFNLDNQSYYLDLKYVKELISTKRLNITKLPYTEDFITGIINIKGDFLLVLDLKKFLHNQSSTYNESSKLIITEGKNFNLALLVDDIKYIKTLKNITPDNTQTSAATNYIYSEIMEENELRSIINFEKIVNDERLYINIY